ncbi:MAG: alpha/beta hydrolase family protein, partial [Gammaproteobacteria bacterium]|nr:alpha/beta hydrolase family protein [Gammaproteobacteria bacterium]
TVAIILLAYCALAQATYKPREERWAQQILDYLTIGEAVWLTDDAQGRAIAKGSAGVAGDRTPGATETGKFLSIYTGPDGGKAKGAVILMHDEGQHPDWPEVTSLLRRSLADQGYATLSLQMPILPRGAPLSGYWRALDEAVPRIRAGMKFLRNKGYTDIALIGHGMGSAMGLGALTQGKVKGVRGFIGVGMAAHVSEKASYPLDARLHAPTMLGKLRLPLLDIYGGLDDKVVTESAPERAAAAKQAGNKDYEQYKIADADHGFGRFEKELSGYVAAWLDKLMTGRKQQ